MKNRLATSGLGTALWLLCALLPTTLVQSSSGDSGYWDDENVDVEIWEKTPEGDYYGHSPSTGPSDPFVYKTEVSCKVGDDALLQLCLATLQPCAAGADGIHVDWYRMLADGSDQTWRLYVSGDCVYGEKPRDILAEIAAQISNEFQQTPIAPATLGSQPGPHTLRGQETNLHAHATEQTFNLTMLGQHITITATPAAYTFNYGDGTTRGPTTSPGAPLPENRIGEQTQTSHAYTTTGHHTITLTTHFNGHYTVNNGPTLPIADQGHITSAPLNLTVWRAITRNYAENCITNPQGTGC
ncbi:PKD domain-containing protein [Arthrobacter alpinus]|uniref:PKD domain-containing protein n=1 Tax=Arthrobacter alpinus TaxID=656366 RepID=UPI000B0103AE|nr:hypothetical protein [Arthrobacter alpinus]